MLAALTETYPVLVPWSGLHLSACLHTLKNTKSFLLCQLRAWEMSNASVAFSTKVTFRCTKKTTSFWGDTCENKGKNVFEKILSKANYLKLSSFTTHAIFFDGNFGEIQCCKKADLLRNWAHSSLFCHVPFQEILKTFFMAQKTHRMSHFYNGFLFVPMTDHWLLRKTRSTNSNCPLLWEEKIKVISTCITTWYDKRRGHQFYVKSQDRTMAKNE